MVSGKRLLCDRNSVNKDDELYPAFTNKNHDCVKDTCAKDTFFHTKDTTHNNTADVAVELDDFSANSLHMVPLKAKVLTCDLCSLTFLLQCDLVTHRKHEHLIFPDQTNIEKNVNFVPLMICYKCDTTFKTFNDLSFHSETHHARVRSFQCTECQQTFHTIANLETHINDEHRRSYNKLPCCVCNRSFLVLADLTNHLKLSHPFHLFNACDDCESTFPSQLNLEAHVVKHVDNLIPQLDGLDLHLFDFSSNPPTNSVRSATYSLNKDKQITKIVKDAEKQDYEINVNNNEENVTIKCSTGFYIQVAKPSFVTLENGSVLSNSNIVVMLTDVTKTNDLNGLETTLLLKCSLLSDRQTLGCVSVHLHHSTRTIQIQGSSIMPDSSKAPVWFLNNVTITKFADLAKLKKFAIKNYNEAVREMPASVSPRTSQADNSCQSCLSVFNTQSKPSQCNSCLKFFHKTTCYKDHIKLCKHYNLDKCPTLIPLSGTLALSSSSSTPVTPLSSTLPLTPTTETLSLSSSNSPHVTSLSSTLPAPPTTGTLAITSSNSPPVTSLSSTLPVPATTSSQALNTSTFQAEVQTPHRINGLQTTISFLPSTSQNTSTSCSSTHSFTPTSSLSSSSLNASASSFSVNSSSQLSVKGPQSCVRPNKKKTKSSIPTSSDDAKNDFLQTELSAAKSRIVQLDTEIVDKDQQLSVLWSRIKILEDKQNSDLLDKYFPKKPNKTPHAETANCSEQSSSPTSQSCNFQCSRLPPSPQTHNCTLITCSSNMSCYQLHHCCSQIPRRNSVCCTRSTTGQSENKEMLSKVSDIVKDIKQLEKVVNEIKSKLQTQNTESKSQQMNPKSNGTTEEESSESPPINPDASESPIVILDASESPFVNLDASIASVEDFITDIPESLSPSPAQLNFQLPTIPLQQ